MAGEADESVAGHHVSEQVTHGMVLIPVALRRAELACSLYRKETFFMENLEKLPGPVLGLVEELGQRSLGKKKMK